MIKQWGKLWGKRGKHGHFWGKHRVKQIRLFGSFFAVKCTNRLSANQAVTTVNGELQPDIKIIFLRDYSSIAACAAASLAIGTRNGEQDT